jgi:adenine-specific DNA-methyltransferase
MAGQVQMVYIDPPYGIKYGSNFQPFVDKRDVKDRKDEDLSQEPEMIKAFRDTWELGIHSYLTYLRNRLLLARDLLADTGSVFVQISDENVHHVREICDEVFGADNFQALITFRKTSISFASERLGGVCDYVVWYSKNHEKRKYNTLYIEKVLGGIGASNYGFVELSTGERRRLLRKKRAIRQSCQMEVGFFQQRILFPVEQLNLVFLNLVIKVILTSPC